MICPHVSMVKGGIEISGEAVGVGGVEVASDEGDVVAVVVVVVVAVVVVVVGTGEKVWGDFVQLQVPRAAMITVPNATDRGRISYV
jgi:hypothetical protein